jgi:hypothetical protein
MLQNPEALDAEAERLVRRLRDVTRAGKRVWLYYGLPAVTDSLKTKLDGRFKLTDRLSLKGPFHKELLVYGGR